MELLKYINNLTIIEKDKYEHMIKEIINSFIFCHGREPEKITLGSRFYHEFRREMFNKNGRITSFHQDNIETFWYCGVRITHSPYIQPDIHLVN